MTEKDLARVLGFIVGGVITLMATTFFLIRESQITQRMVENTPRCTIPITHTYVGGPDGGIQ